MSKSRLLLHEQLRHLLMVVVTVGVLTGISAGNQAYDHAKQRDAARVAASEAHFWKVVAGEESGTAPTVDNRLASDLATRLDDPDAIRDFRGDSNRYGGISDAIGYDPFDGAGLDCVECGPLDAETMAKIEQIQAGKLDEVIGDLNLVADDTFTLTPAGISFQSWYGLLWLVGGPLTLLSAHAALKNDSRPENRVALTDVDTEPMSNARIWLGFLAPPVWVWRIATQRRASDRFWDRLSESFPVEVKLVRRVDRALKDDESVDAHTRIKLQTLRDRVLGEIQVQSLTQEDNNTELHRLAEQLEQASAFFDDRRETLREVEQL